MNDSIEADLPRLLEAWQSVHASSDAAHADPVVLDCARRLAADPGGAAAPLWTFGLVLMADYIACGPAEAVQPDVVDALLAADRALRDRECAHDTHAFERALEVLEQDDIWDHVPDLRRVAAVGAGTDAGTDTDAEAGWPFGDGTEEFLCPRNIAGYARVTADVITPGVVADIPALLPKDHEEEIADLSSLLWDYPKPWVEPDWAISAPASALPTRPTKGVRAGYVLLIHATCWHAASGRITRKGALEEMIETLERVLPDLGDGTCGHAPGEHPAVDGDAASNVEYGYYLISPGGRALFREEYADDEDDPTWVEPWLCPAFLRGLAREALDHLREGLREHFGDDGTDGGGDGDGETEG